jgi:hypothetical protein
MTYVVAQPEWQVDVSGRRFASGFDHLTVVGVGKSVDGAISNAGHWWPKRGYQVWEEESGRDVRISLVFDERGQPRWLPIADER